MLTNKHVISKQSEYYLQVMTNWVIDLTVNASIGRYKYIFIQNDRTVLFMFDQIYILFIIDSLSISIYLYI